MGGEHHQKHKKKEDEIDEQKNKGHRGLNKKLQKRRKHEKEVKKEKKQKKKEYEDKRDQYREQYFAQANKVKKGSDKDSKGIKINKLKKTVNKFLKIYEDDIEDVKGIFSSLDQGEEIEIQDIENPKIRKYLSKIFKYLKVKQKTGKLGYRKSAKTDFTLGTYMNNIINDSMLAIQKNESSSDSESENDAKSDGDSENENKKNYESDLSSDSDDEDNHKKGKSPSKKLKKNDDSDNLSDDSEDDKRNQKNQVNTKKQLGPQLPQKVSQSIGPQVPTQIGPSFSGPSAPSMEPSLISQEDKQKFIDSSLSNQPKENQSNWMLAGDLDSFLNDSFKEVEASNVKKYLQNKKVDQVSKRPQGPQLDSSRLAKGSAPIDLEHIEIGEQDAKNKSAADYEAKYRSKSLMEIHQENLQKKKQEQGKDTFRKPFDRNEDLVIKKTDPKKIFAALKESFQHGPKFQPAKN